MDTLEQVYFDAEGKLTSAGIALYVDAMILERVDDLPSEFHKSMVAYPDSYAQIVRMYMVMQDETIVHPHPYFDQQQKSSGVTVPDEHKELDEFLQNIIREALAEAAQPNAALERKVVEAVKSSPHFKVLKPTTASVYINHISFVLESSIIQKGRFFLQNQAGKFVDGFRLAPDSQRFTIDCSGYESGLYYWTILVGSDTVTDKIYVCSPDDARRIVQQR